MPVDSGMNPEAVVHMIRVLFSPCQRAYTTLVVGSGYSELLCVSKHLPCRARELEVPADSGMYLEAAAHMHSSTDPTSKHAAYLSSSPEERKTQQLAVSAIDKDTLVKEFTFTIAMRSVQASTACFLLHHDVRPGVP